MNTIVTNLIGKQVRFRAYQKDPDLCDRTFEVVAVYMGAHDTLKAHCASIQERGESGLRPIIVERVDSLLLLHNWTYP